MKRIVPAVLSFLLVITGLFAEQTVLTLEKSLDSAMEKNLSLQISRISLDTAQRSENTAWNAFLPSLSGSAGLTGNTSLADAAPLSWTATGSLSLSLPLNAGLSASLDGIRLAYENELITYDTTLRNLKSEVEKNFYSLLAGKADIEIEKANMDLAEKHYEQTLNNFNLGLETELAVLQAKVTAATLKPTYLQAVSDYRIALREFLSAIGMDPKEDVLLEGDLSVPAADLDGEELIGLYLMDRSDIRSQKKNIDILENNRALSVATSYVPSLSLSGKWGTTVGDALEGSSWAADSLTDSLSVGVTLSVPLDGFIPGSSTDTAIKEIDDQIRSAKLTLEKLMDDGRTEIINLVSQLETASAKLDLSGLNVELTRSTYEKSEESFVQGGMERLDLEDAQQNYFTAEQDYLESQYSYLAGLIDLRDALGLESLDDLLK
ncbi:MAG: TolC family protein [Spirochaetales bacterium]|nr:TolC family protein [Spirochaetales bacterium]